MGSSTCYHLAKQGLQVLGLEQFSIPNELSSHNGQTRIIRKAYFEDPGYVPLLEYSYENWKELERISGEQLYYETGLLYFGKPDHWLMQGVHKSAEKYKIPLEELSNEQVNERYPAFNIPGHFEKLLEPKAGFLLPGKAIELYAAQALKHGAVIKSNERVLWWNKTSNGVEVKTSAATYQAGKLVITAGPWTSDLVTGFSPLLKVTRQVIAWVNPAEPPNFLLGKLPCWMIAPVDQPGLYYGFPLLPPNGFEEPLAFKLAHHYAGAITSAEKIGREIHTDDLQGITGLLQKYFKNGYRSVAQTKTCMYTNTPDENFILDFLPGNEERVVIATGFSGHGFKFAPAIGAIMSELAIYGKTNLPIDFLGLKRFVK